MMHFQLPEDRVKKPSVLDDLRKGNPLSNSSDINDADYLKKEIRKLKQQKEPKRRRQYSMNEGDLTWTGIAEKLNTKNDYAFNMGLGWLRWTGTRWQEVEETAIAKDIVEWATKMMYKAIDDRDSEAEKKFYSVRHGCHSNVLTSLKHVAYVPVDAFRDIPWVLNCPNGIVNLKTGELTPHQKNYSLNQTAVPYDPNADMSEWTKVVSQIFPNPELAHYIQVLFGYAITGCVEEELFSIFFGSGKNGKSTICNIVSEVIGSYSGEIPTSELAIKKHQQDNSPHLARLVGKRIIYANEPPEGMLLNDSVIKSLASRDKMPVCAKYKTPFVLYPSWLLILRCNNEPQIRAVDDGVWRRVKKVPFSVIFSTPDKTLDKRIFQNHASAVLRWLVEGAMIYASSGLPMCQTIDTAVSQYRQNQDSIQGWYSACVIQDPNGYTELSKLSQSYFAWCSTNGGYEYPARRLSDFLIKQGFKKVDGTRHVIFHGVKLK
jgi:putative DNA primase/helicase